jgi:Tfp pilus assembly protein PilO
MAEMLANNVIRLLVTVAILGAVYLFIIKPVLDTTNNAFDSVNDSFNSAFDDVGIDNVDLDQIKNGDFNSIQQQIKQADLDQQQQNQALKLLHCVQRVQPDIDKITACQDRLG